MARIRTVKPEFWTSEQVAECSTITRLLFIGMWNFCDDGGNHPASLKSLKMQIFPSDDIQVSEIDSMVKELINHGLIVQYTVNNKDYWHVLGWHHQKIDKPNIKHPPYSKNDSQPFDDHSTNDSQPFTPVRESKVREGKVMDINKKESAQDVFEESAQVEKLKQGLFAKPDTFQITFDWKPTANFETRCKVAGKDYSKFTDDILLSFINYNESREQYKTQKEWEGLLLNAFMRELAKPVDKQQFTNQPKQPDLTPPVYKNWSDEPLPPADKKWGMTPEQLEKLKKI